MIMISSVGNLPRSVCRNSQGNLQSVKKLEIPALSNAYVLTHEAAAYYITSIS